MDNLFQAPQSPIPQQQMPQATAGLAGPQPQQSPTAGLAGPPHRTMNMILKGMAFALAGAGAGMGAKTPGAGAARGVETGVGLAQQGFQNEQEAAKNASAIKFQNVQSAEAAARAAMYDKQLHQMDQQFQDTHNAATLQQMKDLQTMGITPTIMTDNHGDGANAALKQLTDSHGGVPHMFILNLGDKLVGYDLNSMAQGNKSVDLVNSINSIQGKPAIPQPVWAQMSPEAKNSSLSQSLNFWNPMPTKENVGTLVQQYSNWKDTYSMRPDADPDVVSKLGKTVDFLTKAKDQFVKDAATEAGAKAKAESDAKFPNELRLKQIEAQIAAQNRQAAVGLEQRKTAANDLTKADQAYQEVVQKATNIKDSIAGAKNKDAFASAITPLETVLFITGANGVHRINNTEVEVVKGAGSSKDRIEAWFNGKIKGDVVPDDIKAGILRMVDAYQSSAYKKYTQAGNSINSRMGTSLPLVDQNGNIGGTSQSQQPKTPPQGATMKVPGSDGKLHWSDGKQDLGVAE